MLSVKIALEEEEDLYQIARIWVVSVLVLVVSSIVVVVTAVVVVTRVLVVVAGH